MPLLFSLCADALLARVDKANMSQQTLMELCVASITDKFEFQTPSGDFKAIDEWEGVTLDDDGRIVEIRWGHEGMCDGEFGFEWMPASVESFVVIAGVLGGQLPLHLLPRGLAYLNLCDNALEGSLRFAHLPPTITSIDVDSNLLSGSLDLRSLPETLESLCISRNRFEGEIHLDRLPRKMENLLAQENCLSGGVRACDLPETLVWLDLSSNQLCGSFVLDSMPNSTLQIALLGNRIDAVVNANGEPMESTQIQI